MFDIENLRLICFTSQRVKKKEDKNKKLFWFVIAGRKFSTTIKQKEFFTQFSLSSLFWLYIKSYAYDSLKT